MNHGCVQKVQTIFKAQNKEQKQNQRKSQHSQLRENVLEPYYLLCALDNKVSYSKWTGLFRNLVNVHLYVDGSLRQ